MLIWNSRVDQYIIYEYHYKLVQVGFEDPVHEIHEYHRDISEAKGHHYELVMSIASTKGSLLYVFILNSELIAPRMKVYLEKSSHAS